MITLAILAATAIALARRAAHPDELTDVRVRQAVRPPTVVKIDHRFRKWLMQYVSRPGSDASPLLRTYVLSGRVTDAGH